MMKPFLIDSKLILIIQQNKFYLDFIKFLNFIKNNKVELTFTENIKLKVLDLLSKIIPFPDYMKDKRHKLRSEIDWWYIDLIDTLSRISELIYVSKKKLLISEKGKELSDEFSIEQQFVFIVLSYWNDLDWPFFFPYFEEDKDNPAFYLQGFQMPVLDDLVEFNQKYIDGINFNGFAEYLRGKYNLVMYNFKGESLPDRILDCIRNVILEPFNLFGLIEARKGNRIINKYNLFNLDSFKITELGNNLISLINRNYIMMKENR